MPNHRIAIIGGGMAGLAAAVTLAEQGQTVTLYEASNTLGGRARAVLYQDTPLDNGQHILLGAYHQTLRLLNLAKVNEKTAFKRLPLALYMRDLSQSNTLFTLNAPSFLPAPLHILWGLMCANGISLPEKIRAIQLMAWMKLKHFKLAQDQTLSQLLLDKRQSNTLIQMLWEPLCLAALNTPIEQASARVFLNVLRDSFSKHKSDADVLLPAQDLSALLSTPLAQYFVEKGGNIQLGHAIEAIRGSENGYTLIYKQTSAQYSHVIIACGPHQLKQFIPTLPAISALTAHFNYQPITTVYLQYDAHTKLPKPMIGCINSQSQWIFDRGQINQQSGLIAVVISAHPPFKNSQDTLAEGISRELSVLFPQLGKPIWHKVITEKRATFSCNAHLQRPTILTSYKNLYLAGDYTAGDYPATIEGAVRSGIAASHYILEA